MNGKTIGLIVLIVVLLAGVVWSFRKSFMGGAEAPSQDVAMKTKASMEKMMQDAKAAKDAGKMPGGPGQMQHSR